MCAYGDQLELPSENIVTSTTPDVPRLQNNKGSQCNLTKTKVTQPICVAVKTRSALKKKACSCECLKK